MPKVLEDPHNIDGPVIVKYAGAKGGRGYFIARDYRDFRRNVDIEEEFTIQEYVLGCRYYLHFFFDPIAEDGYQVQGKGKHAGKNLSQSRKPKLQAHGKYMHHAAIILKSASEHMPPANVR